MRAAEAFGDSGPTLMKGRGGRMRELSKILRGPAPQWHSQVVNGPGLGNSCGTGSHRVENSLLSESASSSPGSPFRDEPSMQLHTLSPFRSPPRHPRTQQLPAEHFILYRSFYIHGYALMRNERLSEIA